MHQPTWISQLRTPDLDFFYQSCNLTWIIKVAEQEEGETIGMTTNTDVKNYRAVEEVNGSVSTKNGVELRKRKESFARRQQSFQRQNSCGVDIDRPLTREDLRKSFGRANTVETGEATSVEEKDEAGGQVSERDWLAVFNLID